MWKPKCPCENIVVSLHYELCPSLCNSTFHHQDQTYKVTSLGTFSDLLVWSSLRDFTLDKPEWLTRAKKPSVQIRSLCLFPLFHNWSHNFGQGADFLDEVYSSIKQPNSLLASLPPRGDMKTDKQTSRAEWPLRYWANLYFSQWSTY